MGTFNKFRRILKSELLFICCLFSGVELLTCQVLPPQNVTLTWPKDFWPRLSWAPPPHSMKNCNYQVKTRNNEGGIDGICTIVNNTSWSTKRVMEGGVLNLILQTVCNDTDESVNVEIRSAYKDLVKDLQCFIESSTLTNCTWLHATKTSDLRFFYMFSNNDLNKPLKDKSQWTPLVECSAYTYGIRSGCGLQAKPTQTLFILLNGTLDNKPVRNTFEKSLLNLVRPPALNWTVVEAENYFIINWIPPDVFSLDSWEFCIRYTEGDKLKNITTKKVTSYKLPRQSRYQYWISIQAKKDENKTPWTKKKYFSAATDPSAILYPVVIIPLMCAGLAVLTVVCCRKNKKALFPKVPEPRDLLSEISNNNNKSVIHKLYIPAEEEENCKITLVMDPQTLLLANL